jgi:hypothetical protein
VATVSMRNQVEFLFKWDDPVVPGMPVNAT